MKILLSKDLPDLPKVTKELVNTGNFRLYEIKDNHYLLTMESTGDYFILNALGKVVKPIDREDRPKVKLADAISFSDLPTAPSLNELTSTSVCLC